MRNPLQLLKKIYTYSHYHFFEVSVESQPNSYKQWAFRRLLGNLFSNKKVNETYLLSEDTLIENSFGKFYIPKNSDFVFSVSTYAEAELTPYFIMPDEGIFLDIGANAGKYSVMLANQKPTIRVISFEPAPYTFSVLKTNIELNKLQDRVELMQLGLSSKKGSITFAASTKFAGVSHIVETSTGQYDDFDYTTITVEVTKLDDIILPEDIKLIKLIKIDVEGHELDVIKGANTVLKNMEKNSRLIIEIHPEETRINDIKTYLQERGFKSKQIDKENFLFVKN